MKKTTKTIIATMALALSLVMPLAACGGQASQGGSGDTDEQTSVQAGIIDVTTWKTLGDALAVKDADGFSSSAWDENHFVEVFEGGEQTFRVIAKMDADAYKKANELDASMEDYEEKFTEAVSGLELESAEDLTGDKLSQEDMDAYVGKTGQDLLDAGFTFESYYMYGGDETGATMSSGYLAYDVTFDVSIDDDQSEDEGESIKAAKITAVEYFGGSDSAVDPTKV